MKSDRQTYRRPREPVNKRGFAWLPSEGNDIDAREACNIIRLPALQKVTEKPPIGFWESDVEEPPDIECDVGRTLDKRILSELEMTWLTDEDNRHDCGLASGQALLRNKKSPAPGKNECSNKNCTQQSIAFWYTLSVQGQNIYCYSIIEVSPMARSKLSDFDRCECININKLWLEVGELYSNSSEYNSTAALNSAGSETSRRNENWCPGFRWFQFILPMPRDSVMVESVRLVLQRWRGVCSFSQTMRSNWSDEESHLVYGRCPKNEVSLENDHAQIVL